MDNLVKTCASLNKVRAPVSLDISKFEMISDETSDKPQRRVVREWFSQEAKVEVKGCVEKSVDHH